MVRPNNNGWHLWSSHGTVLVFIATHPGCTVLEIAEGLFLTQRTVWGVVGDLRRASMLHVARLGRRHHYRVNLDAEFRHPTIEGVKLGTLLALMPEVTERDRESMRYANGAGLVSTAAR